ncbi:MAG TPA: PDZ domain-containing protein [Polyangiaceae bacterium]|nr:PDZ domain-containing protein [Polyangiaceae bacterium]
MSSPRSLLSLAAALIAGSLLVACPAVYPEIKTPVRVVRAGQALDPPPPNDVRWIAFKGARIPALTRDGRRWGNDLAAGLPDAYAKLTINGVEALRTSIEKGTLTPSWAKSPRGNFRIQGQDKLRVEIWDTRVFNDHPIGIKDLGSMGAYDQRGLEEIQEECDSGATFTMSNEPAHGFVGYGLFYELRTYEAYVTRVYEESPASRLGIRPGDQIVSVDGQPVRGMAEGEVQSRFNAPAMQGLELSLRHEDGSTVTVTLKEGAVYPLFREIGAFE